MVIAQVVGWEEGWRKKEDFKRHRQGLVLHSGHGTLNLITRHPGFCKKAEHSAAILPTLLHFMALHRTTTTYFSIKLHLFLLCFTVFNILRDFFRALGITKCIEETGNSR